jgi:hypothetical protein
VMWSQKIGNTGDFYLLAILVDNYTGPDQYKIDPNKIWTYINLGDLTHDEASFGTTNSPIEGTITVNADEKTGTVNATLMNKDKTKTTGISGSWACSELTR